VRKLVLTLAIILPFLLVGGMVVLVVRSLQRPGGVPMQEERVRVGQGAGNTGGANALGEWLAGRNPDAVQAAKEQQRELGFARPEGWPGGFVLRVRTGRAEVGPVFVSARLPGAEASGARLFRLGRVASAGEEAVWEVRFEAGRWPAGTRFAVGLGEAMGEHRTLPEVPTAGVPEDEPVVVEVAPG